VEKGGKQMACSNDGEKGKLWREWGMDVENNELDNKPMGLRGN
jgi:hypothetical protein